MTQDAWMVTTKYNHSRGFPAEPQRAESGEAEAVSKQNGVFTLAYSSSDNSNTICIWDKKTGELVGSPIR